MHSYIIISLPHQASRLDSLDALFSFYAESYKDVIRHLFRYGQNKLIERVVNDYECSVEYSFHFNTSGITYSSVMDIGVHTLIDPVLFEITRLGLDMESLQFIRWLNKTDFILGMP